MIELKQKLDTTSFTSTDLNKTTWTLVKNVTDITGYLQYIILNIDCLDLFLQILVDDREVFNCHLLSLQDKEKLNLPTKISGNVINILDNKKDRKTIYIPFSCNKINTWVENSLKFNFKHNKKNEGSSDTFIWKSIYYCWGEQI